MKIAIDATAAISGGKLYLEKLLSQFARSDSQHEFIIFHTSDLDQLGATLAGERLKFCRVAIPFLGSGEGASASLLRMLWRKFVLPVRLQTLQPDLLFSNAGTVPRWRPAKMKTVIALHNCMPLRRELIDKEPWGVGRWRLKMLRRQMRKALRACDGSIAFSEDTQFRIKENFGALPHTPSVVHHAIEWGEQERKMQISLGDLRRLGVVQPYLLYVAQFHRYKNVLRLLEAFARLAENHSQLMLVLVGAAADRVYWQEVKAEIAKLNLRDRVVHVPACPRQQLIGLYRGALAFVQPSLAETCSFPLLEALALGVPAAVARMSAMPEMAGEAAVYFDPYQPTEMAEVIERLLWDEALRDELGRKAIAQAARFSWEETARRTLEVFAQVGKKGE